MSAIVFFIASIGAIAGAIGVVMLRNPFYGVLSLVGHLLCLAALFLLLNAEFLAASQVIIYAGAVMVLYVFVVAYVGGDSESLGASPGFLRLITPVIVVLLLVELLIATLGSGLKAIGTKGASLPADFGSPAAIGEALLTTYLLPFEIASVLLLVAAVGAVGLARRRRGFGPGDVPFDSATIAAAPPKGSGTMAEAAGDRAIVGAPRNESR